MIETKQEILFGKDPNGEMVLITNDADGDMTNIQITPKTALKLANQLLSILKLPQVILESQAIQTLDAITNGCREASLYGEDLENYRRSKS